MGLNHPSDLAAWRRWQRSRNRLRTMRAAFARPTPVDLVVMGGVAEPSVLVVLDATTPSALAALLRPAQQLSTQHLSSQSVAVLAPRSVAEQLMRDRLWPLNAQPERSEQDHPLTAVAASGPVPALLQSVRVVLSAGHFLPAGAAAYRWAAEVGATYCVAQHGLLTPFAPPLPAQSHLFAFSAADAKFWCSGREDVTTEPVGSQLLWSAAAQPVTALATGRPVFLGQLHGAELARHISARTATEFCMATGASYRPHPAENDRFSRLQHRAWQRQNIDVESNSTPLQPGRPVAAVFSTGVLEAAAAGAPAWVTCVHPPDWVREFWQRYELSQWGNDPTPAPAQPGTEPSKRIAQQIQKLVET